jgi:hypothetical protein
MLEQEELDMTNVRKCTYRLMEPDTLGRHRHNTLSRKFRVVVHALRRTPQHVRRGCLERPATSNVAETHLPFEFG